MESLQNDIARFVQVRFHPTDQAAVRRVLDGNQLSTPRIIRCVLLLSGGSFERLEHFAAMAAQDVRQVILLAEYDTQDGGQRVPLRDCSRSFEKADMGDVRCVASSSNVRRPRASHYHRGLVKRRFSLGRAVYVIATVQPTRQSVACVRYESNIARLVSLPTVFVLEQLSERIELSEPVSIS